MIRRFVTLVVAAAFVAGLAPAAALGTYDGGGTYVYPPKHVEAAADDGEVALSWYNYGENYYGTLVLRSGTTFAANPTDTVGQDTLLAGPATEVTDLPLTNGTDYYYTLFNFDAGLNYSQPVTRTIFPGIPTDLCAWSDPSCAYYGSTVTLWTHLKRPLPVSPTRGGACELGSEDATVIAGRDDVTLWRSTDHGETWSQDGTATYNAEEELYEATRTVMANTKFQFRFAGDRTGPEVLAAGESNWVWVECKAGVTRPYTPPATRRYWGFNVTGRYLHRPAGRVRVDFYRYTGDRWVRTRYAYARNLSGERYYVRYRLPYRGRWFVRGYYKDANHAPTYTSRRYMVVR